MARSGGISGIGVASATAGGFLMYVGVRDVPIRDGLREILSGKLPEGNRDAEPGGAVDKARERLAAAAAGRAAGNLLGGAVDDLGALHGQLARAALAYVGVPYRWGGSSRSGMDCSGLVWRAFQEVGIDAPRTTYTQVVWKSLKKISASEATADDLVFWPGHVAIVVKPGEVVHAPRPGRTVTRAPIDQAGPRGAAPTFRRYVGKAPTSGGGGGPRVVGV